jgi:hypothetical protein
MTRPEGIFFFGLASIFRVARNWWVERRLAPHRNEIAFVVAFLAVFLPYYIWRWRYYGYAFPNTFYVKSSGGAGTWTRGLYYLRRFVEDYAVGFSMLLVLVGWPPAADRRRRDLFALAALVVGSFAAYVIKVGGDFMGLYRFILPVIPLAAVCVQEAVRTLYRRLEPHVPRPVLGLAGVAVAAAFVAGSVKVTLKAREIADADNGIDSPGYLKHYVDERVPVGLWLAQHARPEHLASVGGAGVIPYYSGMRAFDAYGLVDATIAHDPRMSSGSTRPGHQKWPADWYLLSRRPTIITHLYFLHEKRTADEERWRRNGYEWVTATIPGLSPPPYYSFLKRLDQAFGPFPAR